MIVYSGHVLSYTKLVHRHATQTEGNLIGLALVNMKHCVFHRSNNVLLSLDYHSSVLQM